MSDLNEILTGVVARIDQAAVLCVGDIMLDRFVYGSVDRISPEAPIPVMRVQRETSSLGGVGNVAANVHSLGAKAMIAAVVGEDFAGRDIRQKTADLLGDDNGLITSTDRPSTQKTRYLARNQQLLRADEESTVALPPKAQAALIEIALKQLQQATAVVLSDYGKGVLDDKTIKAIIEAAREKNIPIIVDPMVRDFSRYRGASVVSPNRKELWEATGMGTDGDDQIEAASWNIIDTCGIEAVVATRSEEGLSIVSGTGVIKHMPTEAKEIWDVSGAGDTVVANLAAAIGLDPELEFDERLTRSAAIANMAGGIVVSKVGTATCTRDELSAALTQHSRTAARHQKMVTLPEALDQITKWRRQGLRVGFTNGCFDILHPGHVSLLRQARAQCDKLILGLNSDASISRLKGPTRPVNRVEDRADVLAGLESVDLLIVFDEDTPLNLISAIKPDVLTKGADYTVETVVGADIVLSAGGRVHLAELTPGVSTTNTIERMQAGEKDQKADA
ncbi:MAG TPA: D-glycero-beta-D-manno-heptose 1-phosphate adenylyltransferase [Rhodospirillaceae bacterium]|nr:D-glycero-beta-D-manno-heptose 1-phosphate adenylyltransferase [Alphaproteobacteria bacterium]OUT41358.1 MAG: D-glycero-beta-D-manno-heptose 1-phosphate adenylyltransferase [Micavibrio sp. TMED2]HCI46139.1 D-glycero-beta-D-manno-heptose 1-phosphate adenylyltransferase [Rhodospirillaceae bacterium]MAS47108.1 D-glycero-beta-D-manno-heptose 1-phosphate adenylyltransferase [Alphaproteobacteria bacterium]MAX95203.1 D-glycero-beta-D-manno-heptose 1-phosphate adenylyltransferase [Alphaproteobacteri|tara:strand:+ start:5129 stop:6643 length:1515 start_codon:yes stop_codon:yes gene_type:complete